MTVTDTATPPVRTRPTDRIARWVTEGLSPAVISIAIVLIVGATSGAGPARGIGWALVVLLFICAIPYAVILVGVRRGRYTDHHLGDVRQRPVPLALGLLSAAVGLVIVLVGGGPRALLAAIAAAVVGFAVLVAVSRYWKMSIHCGVAAGSAVIAGIVLGPVALFVGLLVAATVGWSRVRLRDHTVGQVIVGSAVGAAVAGVVFGLLR